MERGSGRTVERGSGRQWTRGWRGGVVSKGGLAVVRVD